MQKEAAKLLDVEKKVLDIAKSLDLSFDEVLSILRMMKLDKKKKILPISIFNNKSLSALETIVKYLKENLGLNYKEIAALLNRNYDPIAITYRNSKRKMQSGLDVSSEQRIPIQIFSNLKLSVLENLTSYLKEELNLTYHEIALILNRDDRTIWTVYNRAKRK